MLKDRMLGENHCFIRAKKGGVNKGTGRPSGLRPDLNARAAGLTEGDCSSAWTLCSLALTLCFSFFDPTNAPWGLDGKCLASSLGVEHHARVDGRGLCFEELPGTSGDTFFVGGFCPPELWNHSNGVSGTYSGGPEQLHKDDFPHIALPLLGNPKHIDA